MSAQFTEYDFFNDNWSDLRQYRDMPEIDFDRMARYRMDRLKQQLQLHDVACGIFFSPISLRYAVNYNSYLLFQSHIPTTYLFIPQDGPVVLHGSYDPPPLVDEFRPLRPQSYFEGGNEVHLAAEAFADDVVKYLIEIGASNKRVAIEYVNPEVTRALLARDIEVVDGSRVSEQARLIKSADEINCIRWAVAVAEHGIAMMKRALKPGMTENQLWALLNYTNQANDGGWHEGRMLASGPRINPWLQEATNRVIESGDLVGFDTDMVGPFGYFADVSRTFHCGPAKPSKRQKQVYQLAAQEIEHNLGLVRPGMTLTEFQQQAFEVPEAYQAHAYTCVMHGVGMCDEYPQVKHRFREAQPYDCELQAGMVLCIESFMGAVGEPDGVKIEQQVLVTENGYEMLTSYPLEEALMS